MPIRANPTLISIDQQHPARCINMTDTVDIVLTEADIPGATLKEPLEVHTIAALRWWLLCRGVQVSSTCKKPTLIER